MELTLAGSPDGREPGGPARVAERITVQGIQEIILGRIAASQQLERALPKALAVRDAAFRRFGRASRFPLRMLVAWRLAALQKRCDETEQELQLKARERNDCRLDVDYDFSADASRAYGVLAAAFGRVAQARQVWELPKGAPASATTTVTGSGIDRLSASASLRFNDVLNSAYPGISLRSGDGDGIDVLPAFAVTWPRPSVSNILVSGVPNLRITATRVHYAERGAIPADGVQVSETWEKANRDGSRDRRFSENAKIPILRYGLLQIEEPGVVSRCYLVSDCQAALDTSSAFTDYQRALAAFGTGTGEPGDKNASDQPVWAPAGQTLGPIVSVPPPPKFGRAHEYTCALIAFLVFLIGGAVPRPSLQSATVFPGGSGPAVNLPNATPRTASNNVQPLVMSATDNDVDRRPTDALPPATALAKVKIRSAVNVRSGPDNTSAVARTANAGVVVSVFAKSNGWVKVGDSEPWGWVYSSFVEQVDR